MIPPANLDFFEIFLTQQKWLCSIHLIRKQTEMQSKEPFLFIFYTLILVLFLIKVNIIYMPFSSDVIAIRFVYIFFYYGSKNTRELQGKFSKPHFSTNCISLYKYRIVRFFNATAGLFSFFGVFSLKGTPPSTQKTNIFSI